MTETNQSGEISIDKSNIVLYEKYMPIFEKIYAHINSFENPVLNNAINLIRAERRSLYLKSKLLKVSKEAKKAESDKTQINEQYNRELKSAIDAIKLAHQSDIANFNAQLNAKPNYSIEGRQIISRLNVGIPRYS